MSEWLMFLVDLIDNLIYHDIENTYRIVNTCT